MKLNYMELELLTNIKIVTTDKAYNYNLNLFNENKIKTKNILTNKSIQLLKQDKINNTIKEIEFILSYNKENKNSKFNIIFKEINEIKYIKENIDNIKK